MWANHLIREVQQTILISNSSYIDINKIKTHWRKAQNNMQVLLWSWNEVLIQIIKGRRVTRQLLFHHRYQILGDFIHLIPCKQIGDLWGIGKTVFCILRFCHRQFTAGVWFFLPSLALHLFSYFLSAPLQLNLDLPEITKSANIYWADGMFN